jgi:hypothetical protein
MAEGHISKGKITNRIPGTIEVFDFEFEVPASEREKFAKDPEIFLRHALEGAGQKVNDVIIGNREREGMMNTTARIHPEGDGTTTIKTIVAHVEQPASMESKHITIQAQ